MSFCCIIMDRLLILISPMAHAQDLNATAQNFGCFHAKMIIFHYKKIQALFLFQNIILKFHANHVSFLVWSYPYFDNKKSKNKFKAFEKRINDCAVKL